MNWIMYVISFILGGIVMFMTICIVYAAKQEEPANRVHFFVARDMDGRLFLYIGKPIRVDNRFSPNPIEGIIALGCGCNLQWYGLNENDYKDLKWEDEPVEVFVNMED